MTDSSMTPERDAFAQLARFTWWLRGGVFVFVVFDTLLASHGSATAFVELAFAAAAMAGWALSGRLGLGRTQLKASCLVVLAAVGGYAASSDHETSILALAIMAVLAAGTDLALPALVVCFLMGVLAVEVGAVRYGAADLGAVLGYPALLAALSLAGRYRRAYAVQAEQSRALLTESRRAQEAAEQAAALTERSRIAREIHDVLAHSLGALGVQIQAAEAMLSERGDVERSLLALAKARALVDVGLTETRRAVHALRTDAPPLPQALEALLGDGRGRVTVMGEPYTLEPAAGLALLRTAQEAVTNARKHAGGTAVEILLSYGDGEVALRIENDLGAGTERDQQAGGYGLAGMHERLRLIDGHLTAGPCAGRWTVDATVPR